MMVDDAQVRRYEGLVHSTAVRFGPYIEEDFDDVKQTLRVKVWRALLSFDPARSSLPQDRYVFGCVTNQVKDLIKKRKRSDHEMGIEDAVPKWSAWHDDFSLLDSFELRVGMATSHDEVYSKVEDEPVELPSTLTATEKQIVNLLLLDLQHIEAARALGMSKSEMARSVRSIRRKMADWKPGSTTPQRTRHLQAA